MDEKLEQKLDRIIELLERSAKPQPPVVRVLNFLAVLAGALSLLAVFDIIKNWLKG
jgi:hypothetical protein